MWPLPKVPPLPEGFHSWHLSLDLYSLPILPKEEVVREQRMAFVPIIAEDFRGQATHRHGSDDGAGIWGPTDGTVWAAEARAQFRPKPV